MSPDTSEAVRIDVDTGSRSSAIWIGDGIAEQLPRCSTRTTSASAASSSRARSSGDSTARSFSASPSGAEPILIPDGERYKNLQSVSRIYEALIRAGADRGSAIVAVGGGVIGDTAGFAAATFLRGITLAHVPTTLLAQVDSSIGGKVGVNHALGKNLIGAFHQPARRRDRSAAARDTAPPRVPLRSVRGREIRHDCEPRRCSIASRSDTKAIFARDADVLLPAIVESCRIKAEWCPADEREGGLRRILNFGHTVGHALEAVTKYRRYRHGEAIALGMLAAADLERGARRAGRTRAPGAGAAHRAARSAAGGRRSDVDEVLEAIRRDKKVVNGRLHFVLAIEIGATMTVDDVTEDELRGGAETARAQTLVGRSALSVGSWFAAFVSGSGAA